MLTCYLLKTTILEVQHLRMTPASRACYCARAFVACRKARLTKMIKFSVCAVDERRLHCIFVIGRHARQLPQRYNNPLSTAAIWYLCLEDGLWFEPGFFRRPPGMKLKFKMACRNGGICFSKFLCLFRGIRRDHENPKQRLIPTERPRCDE